MSALKVGVDLDGVCYPFHPSLRRYLEEHVKHPSDYPDATHWDFFLDWGLSVEDFLKHCNGGVDAGIVFSHGDPFPGVHEALHRIKDAGHAIHVVTDRSFGQPGASAAATLAWLKRHDLPYKCVTFSSDKTVANVDVFIDDKIENYLAVRDAGIDAYLLTRPWNEKLEGAKRVDSLLHFAELIA